MPQGISADGLWRGQEPIEHWLARQQAPLCACGCEMRIVLKKAHRRAGIPRFVWGHHARMRLGNHKGVDTWIEANTGKHFCACGCKGQIRICARHHSMGIPRYLHNHSPRPRLGFGADHPRFEHDRTKVVRPRAFPAFVKRAAYELFGGRCAWCGATDPLECDHIVPASLGGEPSVENAQLLCANCHRWKTAVEPTSRSAKTPESRSRKRKDRMSCP